jgi:hypothetical protein
VVGKPKQEPEEGNLTLTTVTPLPVLGERIIPNGSRKLAEAAAKLQSASELLFLSAGELTDPARAKLLQSFGERLEIQYRLLRRIVRSSQGGHRE